MAEAPVPSSKPIRRVRISREYRLSPRPISPKTALIEPDDLKPVYDAAYARDVTMPAKVWADIFPDIEETMTSMLALADFVASHHDTVKIQGAMIQTSDPSLQPALAAMIDKVREGRCDQQGP